MSDDLREIRRQFEEIISQGEARVREAEAKGFNLGGTAPSALVKEMERQWMLLMVGERTLRKALALTIVAQWLPPPELTPEEKAEIEKLERERLEAEKIAAGEVAHG